MQSYYNYIYLDLRRPCKLETKKSGICLLFEPFYVGKGTGNRFSHHIHVYYKRPFYDKLKILSDDDIGTVCINFLYDEKFAYKNEHILIKEIGTRFDKVYKGPLLNMNLGGEGGISPCAAVRKKISVANMGKNMGNKFASVLKGERNGFYGKTHDDINRAKMRRLYLILKPNNEFEIVTDLKLFIEDTLGFKYNTNQVDRANSRHIYRGIRLIKIDKEHHNNLEDYIDQYKHKLLSLTIPTDRCQSKYNVISPDGTIYNVGNRFKKFCNDNNLSYRVLLKNIDNNVDIPKSSRQLSNEIRMNTIGQKLVKL